MDCREPDMFGLDSWDAVVIVVAGYVAMTCLVRLMRKRRDALVDNLAQQVEAERQRRETRKRSESRRKLRDRLRSR